MQSAYSQWCEANACSHGHCPLGCEHPQPSDYADIGKLICGVCFFYDGTISVIVPCAPEDCQ